MPNTLAEINLLINEKVFETITAETVPYVQDELETGGILIGKWLDEQTILVVAATGAGPGADHRRLTFAVDVNYANQQLAAYSRRYPGVDYIGEWHKHPPTLDRPSSGDLDTAQRLMRLPDYPRKLVNPIVVVRNGQILVNFYYIDRSLNNFVKLQRRSIKETDIPSLLPSVAQVASRPSAPLTMQERGPAWWNSAESLNRLETECQKLEAAGFVLETNDRLDESTWQIVAQSGKRKSLRLDIQLYGNYPDTTPNVEVFYQGKEATRQFTSNRIATWGRQTYLADVARETENRLSNRGRARRVGTVAVLALIALLIVGALGLLTLLSQQQQAEAGNKNNLTATAAAVTVQAEGNFTQTAIASNNQATLTAAVATATFKADATAGVEAITATALADFKATADQTNHDNATAFAHSQETAAQNERNVKATIAYYTALAGGKLTPVPTPGKRP